MPAKEFARFLKNAKQIKDREASLIAKIKKFNFSPEKEKLYRQLLKKFRAEKITPDENKVLIRLTEELESLGVERLKCLAEIAEIRNSTLDDIVRDLKIKPKNYG
jgi:predicted peroxiredoxin